MSTGPALVDDPIRLSTLDAYAILDTPPEQGFDDIVLLARTICVAPVALVSFVASDRQWFKARSGFEPCQTDLDASVCAHVLGRTELLVIPDLTQDPRTHDNPLVTGDPHIRFYAGAPLFTAQGVSLGSLCVIDKASRPNGLTPDQADGLRALAGQVMAQLELRRAVAARDTALLQRREEELRHRQILDSARDYAIVTTDLEGLVTSWSMGAERILGWSADEVQGKSADVIFTPEDRAIGAPEREMAHARTKGRGNDERWHLRKGGQRFWASGEMMPLRDDADRHVGFVKILRDRTTEHLAGRALEDAETRLRQAQEAGGVGLFTVEVVDNILIPTPEFCRLYGVPVQKSYPVHTFEERVIPEDAALVSTSASRARGQPIRNVEYRIRRADTGELRWIARTGEIERDAAGGPVRFVGVARDVTDRRVAEDRLRASEALAHENAERVQLALAAGAIIGTWFWNLTTDRFTVDEAFARAFGLDPALGREGIPLAQIVATVHPDDQAGLADAISEAIGRGGAYAHQYRTRRLDGNYYWLEANGRVDHASDGTPLQFPGVLIDVEARRAVEAERDRVTAMLRSLNETLEQRVVERTTELMRAEEALRQSQKMEAVGQLTGGLAHDFNNLLAGISGSLQLMQTRIGQGRISDVDRYMTVAQGAARRAAALTHRLLAFSRGQTLDPKPTDVNRLVTGMEELVRRTVGPEIHMEVVGAAGLWPALIDPGQLENALLNLCLNARDAMPDGGRITIETANKWLDEEAARQHDMAAGQYLSVCVTDTGTGMPPDLVAKVFEPFFTTKPLGQGTGLGLSMVYGFAKQSGGQVRIYSEEGLGTTMCLYLPRHHGEAGGDGVVLQFAEAGRAEQDETVLIVDDEPSVRMLVAEVLEDLGYTAIEAADSGAGLKVLQSDVRIDLLVTDVGLPGGMNGRQMADAGRERRPDLKVLFITGYAENAVLGNGHLAPGMQVLTKPFAMEVLASRIRDMIRTR